MSFKDTLKGLASEVLADASDLIDSAYQAVPTLTDDITTQAMHLVNEGEDFVQRGLVKAASYVVDWQDKLDNM